MSDKDLLPVYVFGLFLATVFISVGAAMFWDGVFDQVPASRQEQVK